MNGNKMTFYLLSALLWIISAAIVGLALALDTDGYIMAGQTLMMLAGVVGVWAMTALLAGKG